MFLSHQSCDVRQNAMNHKYTSHQQRCEIDLDPEYANRLQLNNGPPCIPIVFRLFGDRCQLGNQIVKGDFPLIGCAHSSWSEGGAGGGGGSIRTSRSCGDHSVCARSWYIESCFYLWEVVLDIQCRTLVQVIVVVMLHCCPVYQLLQHVVGWHFFHAARWVTSLGLTWVMLLYFHTCGRR